MKRANYLILCTILVLGHAFAGTRDQARRLYTSLTGSSPSRAELDNLEAKIVAGNALQAARDITDMKEFYNVTVKDFATPWTNEDGSVLFPLNDMSATVIGFVRDEKDFRDALWKNTMYQANDLVFYTDDQGVVQNNILTNRLYVHMVKQGHPLFVADDNGQTNVNQATASILAGNFSCQNRGDICRMAATQDNLFFEFAGRFVPTLIPQNNAQYESMEAQGLNLGDPQVLISKPQNPSLHTIVEDPRTEQVTAGLLTTRAYGAAYFSAGTNRAAVAFAMQHFMCKSMEELNDISTPDFRVRRDVDRAPGGVPSTFKNFCVGCHAGMDALAGAFAYYDFDGVIKYKFVDANGNGGGVVKKMNHNVIFPDGFITQSDSWINLWSTGQNANMNWGSTLAGNGAKSFGKMLSEAGQFPKCMAQQVFEKVCFSKVDTPIERETVDSLAARFVNNNYNMKFLFMDTAIACMGD